MRNLERPGVAGKSGLQVTGPAAGGMGPSWRKGSFAFAVMMFLMVLRPGVASPVLNFAEVWEAIDVADFPTQLVTADFNEDARPDLAVLLPEVGQILVFLGRGGGQFEIPGITLTLPFAPFGRALAAFDIEGDGRPDLALLSEEDDAVAILRNLGEGSFGQPRNFEVGAAPGGIAAGDLDRDGALDLVTVDSLDETVSILFGFGDGDFSARLTFSVGADPVDLVAVDLDGDGNLDLAVLNQSGGEELAGSVSLLKGRGNGLFEPQVEFESEAFLGPSRLMAEDLNADGRPDLVVMNPDGSDVVVLLNRGRLEFEEQGSFPVSLLPNDLTIRDLDGDGRPDLAVTGGLEDKVGVLRGVGDGTFLPLLEFAVSDSANLSDLGLFPFGIVAADFDGDGRQDLAMANQDGGTVSFLRNDTSADCPGDCNGDGEVTINELIRMVNVALGAISLEECEVGDLDGDGEITVNEIIRAVNAALTGCGL